MPPPSQRYLDRQNQKSQRAPFGLSGEFNPYRPNRMAPSIGGDTRVGAGSPQQGSRSPWDQPQVQKPAFGYGSFDKSQVAPEMQSTASAPGNQMPWQNQAMNPIDSAKNQLQHQWQQENPDAWNRQQKYFAQDALDQAQRYPSQGGQMGSQMPWNNPQFGGAQGGFDKPQVMPPQGGFSPGYAQQQGNVPMDMMYRGPQGMDPQQMQQMQQMQQLKEQQKMQMQQQGNQMPWQTATGGGPVPRQMPWQTATGGGPVPRQMPWSNPDFGGLQRAFGGAQNPSMSPTQNAYTGFYQQNTGLAPLQNQQFDQSVAY